MATQMFAPVPRQNTAQVLVAWPRPKITRPATMDRVAKTEYI